MTWLKGTTTWGELPQKIARLVCGEVADDSAVTCASGDQWVREFTRTVTDGVLNSTTTVTSATAAFTSADKGANVIGTGIPGGTTIASVTNGTTIVLSASATATASGVTLQICHDTIRTKSALDVSTGDCGMRTGYFALAATGDLTMATSKNTVCRVVNPFTSDPSTSGFHRWIVLVEVNAANSVSGNYSTATVREYLYDADNGTAIVNGASRSVTSAGLVTSTNGFTYNVTDPSGFLTTNTGFMRAFTSTYMYGIDYWPMFYRTGNTAPSFTVAPPGTAGTDYDVIAPIPYPPRTTIFASYVGDGTRGGLFGGLGIKTSTGLGAPGALYTVSQSMALAKGRIFINTGGILSLDVGQSRVDTVNGQALRAVGGLRITNWAKCATTAGSVTSSSAVQYWISVKADGIVLVLNMDTAATGKLGTAFFGAFTPADTTYDLFPIAFNHNAALFDYTADQSTNIGGTLAVQYGYLALKRRQDGSEGSRDWQTKWMRSEGANISEYMYHTGQYPGDITLANTSLIASQVAALTPIGINTNTVSSGAIVIPMRQAKPAADGKWWLYGTTYAEGDLTAGGGGSGVDEARNIRGYQNTRFLYLPGDSWASGDELTDTATGTKYLLVQADYHGVGFRFRTLSNTYFGGTAIAEV